MIRVIPCDLSAIAGQEKTLSGSVGLRWHLRDLCLASAWIFAYWSILVIFKIMQKIERWIS